MRKLLHIIPALLLFNNAFAQNVGIGTTAPTGKLTVFGSSLQDLTLQVNDNSLNQGIAFQNSGGSYTWNIYRKDIGNNLANLVFANGLQANISNLEEVVTFRHGGNVGIGASNPTERLEVSPNSDVSAIIGRAHIGYVDVSDAAAFSHFDHSTSTGYAVKQTGDGATHINKATNQSMYFNSGDNPEFVMQSDGDLRMVSGNVIKMRNNLVYVEDRNEYCETTNSSSNNWYAMSDYTGNLTVEANDVILVRVSFRHKISGGSNTDDVLYRLYGSGCTSITSETSGRDEDIVRGKYTGFSFQGVATATCDGTLRFRLELNRSYTDDDICVSDIIITAELIGS